MASSGLWLSGLACNTAAFPGESLLISHQPSHLLVQSVRDMHTPNTGACMTGVAIGCLLLAWTATWFALGVARCSIVTLPDKQPHHGTPACSKRLIR